jgi:Bardet-Biedl syndrome 1 protein
MADVLQGYSAASGARQWSLLMPAAITGLRLLPVSSARALKCVVVSLANGEVRLYRDKALLSVHASASPVLGLHAGRYAREDNSLVVVTAAGGLDIKVCVCAGRGGDCVEAVDAMSRAGAACMTGPGTPPPHPEEP